MKKSMLLITALAFSAVSFAQKKELKEVKKAIDKDELSQAQSLLESLKSSALNDRKSSAEYYLLKGEIALKKAIAANDINALSEATNAFNEAKKVGGKTPTELDVLKGKGAEFAVEKGQSAYENNDFKQAAIAFEQVYRLSPKDTLFLYNAAVSASQGKEKDMALNYFLELRDLKYDGSETLYAAKNKETGQIEKSADKNIRDMKMKTGNYTNPTQEKTPSKKREIISNIAYIYVDQGKKEEAIKAFEFARKNYPKDAELLTQEANVYYQLGNIDKYVVLTKEVTELQPDNVNALYNIGVINLQKGNNDQARIYFQKVLKVDPKNADAAMNCATTFAKEGDALVDPMNALGNTASDIKKFNELKAKKDNLYRQAAEVLNEYVNNDAKEPNKVVLEYLSNIYLSLNDVTNYNRIRAIAEKK